MQKCVTHLVIIDDDWRSFLRVGRRGDGAAEASFQQFDGYIEEYLSIEMMESAARPLRVEGTHVGKSEDRAARLPQADEEWIDAEHDISCEISVSR